VEYNNCGSETGGRRCICALGRRCMCTHQMAALFRV